MTENPKLSETTGRVERPFRAIGNRLADLISLSPDSSSAVAKTGVLFFFPLSLFFFLQQYRGWNGYPISAVETKRGGCFVGGTGWISQLMNVTVRVRANSNPRE